jgi:hypothetical protein
VDHAATLEGKAAHAQAIIGRQIGQLARLVDELLDMTRVTTGKIVLNRGPGCCGRRRGIDSFTGLLTEDFDRGPVDPATPPQTTS